MVEQFKAPFEKKPSFGDVLLVSSAQISASRLLRTLIIAFKGQAKMDKHWLGKKLEHSAGTRRSGAPFRPRRCESRGTSQQRGLP